MLEHTAHGSAAHTPVHTQHTKPTLLLLPKYVPPQAKIQWLSRLRMATLVDTTARTASTAHRPVCAASARPPQAKIELLNRLCTAT